MAWTNLILVYPGFLVTFFQALLKLADICEEKLLLVLRNYDKKSVITK